MKRNDLIEALQQLPEDAEVCVMHCEDILGEYRYFPSFMIEEQESYKDKWGTYQATYSNYAKLTDEKMKVWVLS